jgi:hypothetical protein
MVRSAALLVGLLAFLAPTEAAIRPKESAGTLDRTLCGQWKGGACQGTWTFRADGTFELKNYSPGNNTLAGEWGVRWNAHPPTLGATFSKSELPEHVGKKWELRIVRLDDEALTFEYPCESKIRFVRVQK